MKHAWRTVSLMVVPKAPNNLTATRNGSNVDLAWNGRSPLETRFELQQVLGSGGSTTLLFLPANRETHRAALQPRLNRFRVCAHSASGKSWFSNEIAVTTY